MGTGVLKWKKEGERLLQGSGLPWTIVRPNRLTDGPYTSYDLNTLLKAGCGAPSPCMRMYLHVCTGKMTAQRLPHA